MRYGLRQKVFFDEYSIDSPMVWMRISDCATVVVELTAVLTMKDSFSPPTTNRIVLMNAVPRPFSALLIQSQRNTDLPWQILTSDENRTELDASCQRQYSLQ